MELVSLANKYTQSVTTSSPASSIKMFFKLFKKKNYNKCSTKKKNKIIKTDLFYYYDKCSTKKQIKTDLSKKKYKKSGPVSFSSNKCKQI